MEALHERVAEVFRIMGDASRFKVLSYLFSGPHNVSEIVRGLGMKQSLVSHHLRVLKQCGLVKAQRDGAFVEYSVDRVEVYKLVALATDIVKQTNPQ